MAVLGSVSSSSQISVSKKVSSSSQCNTWTVAALNFARFRSDLCHFSGRVYIYGEEQVLKHPSVSLPALGARMEPIPARGAEAGRRGPVSTALTTAPGVAEREASPTESSAGREGSRWATDVELPRPGYLLLGVKDALFPLRQPSGHAADGK